MQDPIELMPGETCVVSMELAAGKTYEVFVKPNSKKEGITIQAGQIVVRVREPAQDGKANKAIVKLFRDRHAISIEIVSGYTSRRKRVLIKKSGRIPQTSIQQLSLF